MDTSEASSAAEKKRAYASPQLIIFGEVKTLTAGGSGCVEGCLADPFLGGNPG